MFLRLTRPLLFLFLVIFPLFSCTHEQTGTLKVGTNVWPGYEPLYLARSSGFLDLGRIKMVEFNSASEVLSAFRNHSVDVAALTLDETISLIADRPDTRIILGTDFSAGGDVVVAQTDIKSIQQLKGKKVGVESTALGAYVLSRVLELNHLTTHDIQIVFMEVNQHTNAFIQHEVDAVVTFDPVKTQLVKHGGNIIFSSQQIPGEIIDVLVTREDVINKKHPQLKMLVNGWFESLDLITQKRADALQKMAPRLSISVSELDSALGGLKLLDRADNQQLLSGKQATIISTANKTQQTMISNGLVAQPVFGIEHINSQFVDKK
ncbi:ABC transporter substrate-binding protein [Neptunomonas antarctica]|uniref:NitT/TauT family transport system substrate-binding protein n=1 Tax=Neptunomonas antarctica TaxID=619304 RepID=A0A1N7N9D7_9GAMM|nr:ABC transporter substrate-binding protein [Neptunomonas antarctica]SIS94997.1 NitT/TauT family transport system substrate-binding protein [Neptunomonas antarctica]